MINGANSRMVARITHKTVKEEASRRTRTFDVVTQIRARRLQWLGHILRMGSERLVHQAVRHIAENRSEGDLLMDAPRGITWQKLCDLAQNRIGWRQRVRHLRDGTTASGTKNDIQIEWNPALPGCAAAIPRNTCTPCSSGPETPLTPSKLAARKYRRRVAHERFFRHGIGGDGKRKRKRKAVCALDQRPELTKKQRAAAAREYYERNFDPRTTKWISKPAPASTANTTITTTPKTHNTSIPWPLSPWSPQILGHHREEGNGDLNKTIQMTPTKFEDMWAYQQDRNARPLHTPIQPPNTHTPNHESTPKHEFTPP